MQDMQTKQALLILDMQNDFCHPDGKMHAMVKDELASNQLVDSVLRLARAAQSKGITTILMPIHFDYEQPDSPAPEGIAAPIVEAQAFDGKSFGGALIDEIAQLAKERNVTIMPKPTLSAFAGTDLDALLKSKGIEEVFVAGLLTNFCVENTVRDAFDLGYRVRVVRDATATFDSAQRDYAVDNIFPMLGQVVTVEELAAGQTA